MVAREEVAKRNKIIEDYTDKFAAEHEGDKYTIEDWFKYNTGIQSLIRDNFNWLHKKHTSGDAAYKDYKINMQTGIIK